MKDPIQNLRDLRKKAASINATLIEDLKPFFGSNGLVFRRLPDSDEEGNVTNTCSCLMALATSGDSVDFLKQALDLDSEFEARSGLTDIFQNAVSSEWTSSGLPDDNAFTSLIVLRTGGLLSRGLLTKPALDMSHALRSMKGRKVRGATARTLRTIARDYAAKAPDSFGVGVYPSTPAIAYWFVDAVENLRPNIGKSFWDKITSWSSETFARQVSLVRAHHDSMKDPVAMGLAACLATRLRRIISDRSFRARDRLVQKLPTNIEVEAAILNAFHFQEKSGIWP